MINSFLIAFIRIYLKFFSILFSYIGYPLLSFVNDYLPNFNDYVVDVTSFINRLLNGVAFAREVFLNATGFPRGLYFSLVLFFFLRVSLMTVIRSYKFLLNSIAWLRSGHFIPNKE